MTTKAVIRKEVRELVRTLPPEQRASASRQACALLEQQAVWQNAKSIFFYAPLAEELDLWPLVQDSLSAGKIVCLPRFDSATNRYIACQVQSIAADIAIGKFGVREPGESCVMVPLNRLDLILVPGVAFNLRGHRLGRGKGFYDQLLVDAGGIKCGVAFDEQIITEIPVEPHDVLVNCILTPTRWIEPQAAPVLE
ncbi:MAG TPA: 5-formyltetrahydrofolate cyclo-ligase [Verrucomicrobiae bacterium]|jgi:5-formyltetrahydrofolate cyclo-ligase|nr:5-formyltetrahydrofolate cyclo-ligase [Verrucomicrobiae bacterium]